MTSFPLFDTQTVIWGAKTYARDLAERGVATFLQGSSAVAYSPPRST